MGRPPRNESVEHIYVEIGKRISRARIALGLSQETLAVKVGLQRSSVTNIERGRQRLMVHTLFDVARALHVSLLDLLPADATSIDDHATISADRISDDIDKQFVMKVLQFKAKK